jgi:hypothetical protein
MQLELAPAPEIGTRIVFVGSTKGEHLTLDVDQNPPVVGQLVSSGGLHGSRQRTYRSG